MSESTDIVVVADDNTVVSLSSFNNPGNSFYSSIKPESFADRLGIVEAMGNAVPLNEHYNEPFLLRHFIVQTITVNDEESGSVKNANRTILIGANGEYYAAVSEGIVKALQNLVAVVGTPEHWDSPVPVVAVEERGRKFRYTTLKIVPPTK